MNITAQNTPAAASLFKGIPVTFTMTNGDVATGTFLSVNSKGWNLIDGTGATISRSIAKVASVILTVDPTPVAGYNAPVALTELLTMEDAPEIHDNDIFEDAPGTDIDALVAELDGASTRELADVFGIAAKELRVHLRALGMGVGKGHRYHLTADQINTVKVALNA